MRLINTLSLEPRFFYRDVPPYVILSHRWGEDEVTLEDIEHGTGRHKHGFRKLQATCEVARSHGYAWIWIDSCCINRSSSAELSEAINSMYSYYANADLCYAFLEDVNVGHDLSETPGTAPFHAEFRHSNWFTRGWTLQELVAPSHVHFYDHDFRYFGSKHDLAEILADITGIDCGVLSGQSAVWSVSVADRLKWAMYRRTTRTEDQAYCLLGLLGVSMPLLYGEGGKCFARLQEEIARTIRPTSFDHFFVTPRRKSFFHVYVDKASAQMQQPYPAVAWTTNGNTALVVVESQASPYIDIYSEDHVSYGVLDETRKSLSCNIALENHGGYRLEFHETSNDEIAAECTEIKPGKHCCKATVVASELKQMRRYEARVFTVLVSFDDKDPSADINLCGKPSRQGNISPSKATEGASLRNKDTWFRKLKQPVLSRSGK